MSQDCFNHLEVSQLGKPASVLPGSPPQVLAAAAAAAGSAEGTVDTCDESTTQMHERRSPTQVPVKASRDACMLRGSPPRVRAQHHLIHTLYQEMGISADRTLRNTHPPWGYYQPSRIKTRCFSCGNAISSPTPTTPFLISSSGGSPTPSEGHGHWLALEQRGSRALAGQVLKLS